MSFTLYFKLLGYLMSSLVEFNIFFRDREKSPTPDSAVELDPLPIENSLLSWRGADIVNGDIRLIYICVGGNGNVGIV